MKELLKNIINSSLGSLGFEIRRKRDRQSMNLASRIYNLRASMEDVLDHFVALGFIPRTVIDVGVAYGTPALYTRFPNAKHLLIEPIEEFKEKLQMICRQYNAEYVLAAAGARSGQIEIGVSSDLVGSSLLQSGGEKRQVLVVTLDGICQEKGLKGPYLVKIDVQGAELDVLDGATTVLKETDVVILEVSFFHFADGYPEFYDVIDYMKKHEFVAYEIFGGHNRPLDGARAQVDIAFVKQSGKFRESHTWATPGQTLEFHRLSQRFILGSFSNIIHCLT
jgi:FkbM family methyltransferase